MKFALLPALALTLSGCATCDQHPIYCSIAGAVLVGSVAATLEAHSEHDHPGPLRTIQPVPPRASIEQGPARPVSGR